MKNIKLIAYDFDGVMTDNKVYIDQNGIETVKVSRADGLAISKIKKMGITQIIISTEENKVVSKRAKKLNILCLQGIVNKEIALKEFTKKVEVNLGQVIFVGNDVNDIEVMKSVGHPVCPSDAHKSIKLMSSLVLESKGGDGVVRELLDYLIMQRVE
tara:strand:+ start:60 stop:530 length:471 start_codon:yes stop_codon:yes gene_type:complete